MKNKFVWKFGTGHPVPKSAIYLCTQVETVTEEVESLGRKVSKKMNHLVWHYYEVEEDTARSSLAGESP